MQETFERVMRPIEGEPPVKRGRRVDPELAAILEDLKEFEGQWVLVFEDAPVVASWGDPLKAKGVEIRRSTTYRGDDSGENPSRRSVWAKYTGEVKPRTARKPKAEAKEAK